MGALRLLPTSSGVPMAARTAFFDEQTLSAIDAGIHQVVLLGAGYDGRALRFAAPHVRFYEVDYPTTQADKQRRLRRIGAHVSAIRFVNADLSRDDLGERLRAAGFDGNARTLFTCEGLLPYLQWDANRHMLEGAARAAGPGSWLAVNFHVRPPTNALLSKLARRGVDALLSVIGEPRRSEFGPGDPERLLAASRWRPDLVREGDHEPRHGYGLFVRAVAERDGQR